jgi:hypothetical protein
MRIKVLLMSILFILCCSSALLANRFYYDVAYGMSKREVKKTLPKYVVYKKDKGDMVIYKKKNDQGNVIAEVHFFFTDGRLTSVEEYYIKINATYDVYTFFKDSNLKNGELVSEKIKENKANRVREPSTVKREDGTMEEDSGFARHIETTIRQTARDRVLTLILDENEPYFTIIFNKI